MTITRRHLLASTTGALGTLALTACAPGGDQGRPSAPGASANVASPPTHVPFPGVQADKPATAAGLPPVYYNYPRTPLPRDGYPRTGIAPFTALAQGVPPQVAPRDNKAYAQMARSLGTSFAINFAPFANYVEKFQVTVAGGDLPDLAMIVNVAQLPRLLEQKFTDLTDVLGGGNVKKYPGLANIPTESWKVSTLNGRLWGIPQPRPAAGFALTSRGDVMASHGINDPNLALRDGKDFVQLLEQLTDKAANQFAMGADPNNWLLTILLTMMGAPNGWQIQDGKFVSQYETEQYAAALDEAGKIVRAGYLHPNSFSDPASNFLWFKAGTTSLFYQSFVGWNEFARLFPDWQVGNIELPRWDGSGPAAIRKSLAGYSSYTAIRKADGDRLDQLLQVCDHIASPFGTQEFLDVNYGVVDYNYNLSDSGNPVPIANNPGIVAGITYAGSNSGAVIFGQGETAAPDAQYDYLTRLLPDGLDDASWSLYSETAVTQGAALDKQRLDLQRDIMLGSKSIADWQAFVKMWKERAGAKIAGEYEAAAAAN